MKNNNSGFSLVEVLVAIAIFGTLVMVILTPILNSYTLLGRSKTNVQSSADASRDLEKARQIILSNYNSGTTIQSKLATLTPTLPTGTTLTCKNVNTFGNEMSDCPALDSPPMRQLTLKRTINNKDLVLKVSVRP